MLKCLRACCPSGCMLCSACRPFSALWWRCMASVRQHAGTCSSAAVSIVLTAAEIVEYGRALTRMLSGVLTVQAIERAMKMVQELISGEPGSAQAIIQKVRGCACRPRAAPLYSTTILQYWPSYMHFFGSVCLLLLSYFPQKCYQGRVLLAFCKFGREEWLGRER